MAEIVKRCSSQPLILMDQNWVEQEEIDLTKPRHAAYKQRWNIDQDAEHWVDIGRAQLCGKKGDDPIATWKSKIT